MVSPAWCLESAALSAAERTACGERWLAAMRRGDFEAAWRATDQLEAARRRTGVRGEHDLRWDGTPLAGQRVLVRCEHGLGDTIQFIRYAAELKKVARRVTVRAQPMLLELLRRVRGIDELVDAWTVNPDPENDVTLECMELAYAFRHTPQTLPRTVPYLHVSDLPSFALPERAEEAALRVGLIWAASAWDPRRNLPVEELAALAELHGIQFFSLQQGPEADDFARLPLPVIPLSPQTTAVVDAARAMAALDAIITVDSMTAHLAGALGRPTCLLLTNRPDWRWQDTGESSPWYPTMRLCRQTSDGSWQGALRAACEFLRDLRASV